MILTPQAAAQARPSQSQPSLTALAWPGDFKSQSHLKPGQSRGFQAKPGRNNTNPGRFQAGTQKRSFEEEL
jgi:hypothetical protein